MEDDLKIVKVKYLSNHWSDFPQISNLSWGDQTKIKNPQNEYDLQWKTTSNGRGPPMEEDLKILKVEFLSNHWSDFTQILNLSLGDQTKITNAWKEDDHQWKKTSKYQKLNISGTTGQIFLKF